MQFVFHETVFWQNLPSSFKAGIVKRCRAVNQIKAGRVHGSLKTGPSGQGEVPALPRSVFNDIPGKHGESFWGIGGGPIYDFRLLIAD